MPPPYPHYNERAFENEKDFLDSSRGFLPSTTSNHRYCQCSHSHSMHHYRRSMGSMPVKALRGPYSDVRGP